MAQLPENVRAFLEQTHFATIGTTNRNGPPHQTALWYLVRGDTVLMNTASRSKKVRNLKRDARASVLVVDHAEARHVTLEGTVKLDDSQILEDLTALASRYAGESAGPGIATNIARIPHVSLVLTVERIKTFGKI